MGVEILGAVSGGNKVLVHPLPHRLSVDNDIVCAVDDGCSGQALDVIVERIEQAGGSGAGVGNDRLRCLIRRDGGFLSRKLALSPVFGIGERFLQQLVVQILELHFKLTGCVVQLRSLLDEFQIQRLLQTLGIQILYFLGDRAGIPKTWQTWF